MAAMKVKSQKSKVKTTTKKSKVAKKTLTKKAEVKKVAAKPVRKVSAKKNTVQATVAVKTSREPAKKKQVGLNVEVYDSKGKRTGTLDLPKEVFGVDINKDLIAQAVRVFRVNQRQGTRDSKTRGEVNYSTRKIYRQKGTGRARHGGRGAPIFVKGGVAHGPKPYNYQLKLSKNMRAVAFTSALSAKCEAGHISVVSGLDKIEPKTKNVASFFESINMPAKKRNALLVLPKDIDTVTRAARNLAGVSITTAQRLNTYEVLAFRNVILMKDAIEALQKRVGGEK